MKRHILFILTLLLSALYAQAEPVTAEKAREKAAAFFSVQQTAGARRRAPAARQLRLAAQGRDNTYYIFNAPNDDGGYVVVSGDDATEEILGYSNSGTFDPDNIPCCMKWIFDNYASQIKYIRDNGITREDIQHSRLNSADNGFPESYKIDQRRLTKFDQHEPYNDQCPKESSLIGFLKRTLTGCVATAMAGLMYAYKWPKATTAATIKYGAVKRYPQGTAIDWDNILNQYGYRDGKDYFPFEYIAPEKKEAIATLMSIAGITVWTSYGPSSSSSNIEYVPDALRDYFGYDDCVRCKSRKGNESTWLNDLKDEIFNRGPVLYRGVSNDGKDDHAFLLEGWEGNKFYINNGHSGNDNFLCYLNVADFSGEAELTPNSEDQKAIFNVRPLRPEVEVTGLRFDNLNHTSPSLNVAGSRRAPEALTFNENKLSGSITFHNKGECKSWKLFFLQLRDVEAADTLNRVILKSLAPDETYTYNFSFSNLTIGHHYVLSSLDIFGDDFYQSEELLCAESPTFADAEDDSGPKKLTRLEYWFDDNVGALRWATLTKSETVARGDINTDGLEDGVHRLNYRVQRDDGKYSAVSSSTFVKLTKEQENRLDYWLDDDLDNKQTLEIESGEDEQLLELDLSSASLGYHRLNMQIALKGSLSGTVISQGLMKLPTGFANELEYWFDNDIAHAQRLTGKRAETGEAGFIYVNELDLSALPVGIHTLNMRAVSPSGLIKSSVFSYPVMKLPMGQATQVEYWFDNDIANPQRLNGKRAEAGEPGFIYVNELDLSALPIGIHTLNFRAVSPSGTIKSSIISQPVMKLPMSQVGQLEYWFDGDIAHSHTLSGSGDAMSLTGCLFTGDLDLTGITPGHHRLYYRAKSSNGQTATSIGSAAIMVKSQYGADGEATMASYSVIVDDELVSYGPLAARQEVTFSYALDTKDLTPGVHKLKTTFWNSFGLSVTEQVPFKVVEGIHGDVNCDGGVDVADIATIIDVMAGNADEFAEHADVNGDGAVDVADIAEVISIMAELARKAKMLLEETE